MPIRPENRHRYGPDWDAFSLFVRFTRAGGYSAISTPARAKSSSTTPRAWPSLDAAWAS